MFKLMVVAGPHQGETYQLPDGQITIGRQDQNSIVIGSTKVSKRHCVLVVNDGQVVVQDQGSSNGTFVNGVLASEKKLKSGDKISVGDVVFELIKLKPRATVQSSRSLSGVSLGHRDESNGLLPSGEYVDQQSGGGGYAPIDSPQFFPQASQPASNNIIPFPVQDYQQQQTVSPVGSDSTFEEKNVVPQDLIGKITYYFEQYVMPSFYGLNYKTEWRAVSMVILCIFILVNVTLSVQPLIESNRQLVLKEVQRRARVIARDIVDRNTLAMAAKSESKTEIGFLEKEPGIRFAVLTDLSSRIIAPTVKSGQYLTEGSEAVIAVRAREEFRRGAEKGISVITDDQTVVAVEPLKVFNPQKARNDIVAMAVVSVDASGVLRGSGETNLIYSETLILHFAVGLVCFFILYRLTVKRFEVLNDEIDQVLKGNRTQVTNEFQSSEFDSLIGNINSALQRAGRNGGNTSSNDGAQSLGPDEVVAPLRAMAEAGGIALSVLDTNMRIVSVNGLFTEITGISESMGLGQELPSAARDQGISSLFSEMLLKTASSTEGVSEDTDFNGVAYRIRTLAFGQVGVKPGSFAVIIERKE